MEHDQTVSSRQSRAPTSIPDALPAQQANTLDAVNSGVHHAPERSEQVPMTPAMRTAIAGETRGNALWDMIRSLRSGPSLILLLIGLIALPIMLIYFFSLLNNTTDGWLPSLMMCVFTVWLLYKSVTVLVGIARARRKLRKEILEDTVMQLTGPLRLVTVRDKGYEGGARLPTEVWIGESLLFTTDDRDLLMPLREVTEAVAERTTHTEFTFEIRDAHTGAVCYRDPCYLPDSAIPDRAP